MVAAIGDAYREADPKIEQTISFQLPAAVVEDEVLGRLRFDPDSACWTVRRDDIQVWVSGTERPDADQLALARKILSDPPSMARLRAAAEGEIAELELWKAGCVIVHTKAGARREIAWPTDAPG